MRLLVLVLAAMFVLSLPTLAGPLTGAPAIKFEVGAAAPGEPAAGNWALGVGYTTFNFKFGNVLGQDIEASQSGAIVSAEYSRAVGETGDKQVAFGGWVAPVSGDGMDSTMGEIHFRYGFNRSWGVEIGRLMFDAGSSDGGLGTFMGHVVYQLESASEKPVKAQFGLGFLQGAFDEAGIGKIGTGASLFANVSYPFSQSVRGYLSVWGIAQTLEWDQAIKTAVPGIGDVSITTVQWSIGASHEF